MDKLKEYLLNHRADLDIDSPAGDTWEFIASKMPAKSASSKWVVRYAAAACLIALAGAGLWLVSRGRRAPADTAKLHVGTIVRDSAKGGVGAGAVGTERSVAGAAKGGAGGVSGARPKTRSGSRKPAGVSDEIGAIDKNYSSLIDYELKKLRATPLYAENGSYFSFYVEQFKQMDVDEREVRNAIKTYGLTNEFLEQLINVYQQKLNLLKNLQAEINKMNNKVREKEAPSANAEVHYLNI